MQLWELELSAALVAGDAQILSILCLAGATNFSPSSSSLACDCAGSMQTGSVRRQDLHILLITAVRFLEEI